MPGNSTGFVPGGTMTTLSNNYLQKATSLSIARTMIHESIHAYLMVENGNSSSSLYNALLVYAQENGYDYSDGVHTNNIHHNFMGEYIEAISYSLFEWDKNYGTGGILNSQGHIDINYYKAMAFGGFYTYDSNNIRVDYDSFKELVPYTNEREKIIKIILNEREGYEGAKGNDC